MKHFKEFLVASPPRLTCRRLEGCQISLPFATLPPPIFFHSPPWLHPPHYRPLLFPSSHSNSHASMLRPSLQELLEHHIRPQKKKKHRERERVTFHSVFFFFFLPFYPTVWFRVNKINKRICCLL